MSLTLWVIFRKFNKTIHNESWRTLARISAIDTNFVLLIFSSGYFLVKIFNFSIFFWIHKMLKCGHCPPFLVLWKRLEIFLSRDTEFKCIFKRLNAQMGRLFPKRTWKNKLVDKFCRRKFYVELPMRVIILSSDISSPQCITYYRQYVLKVISPKNWALSLLHRRHTDKLTKV